MANLICFPHYTCGGLLSDILNNKFSMVNHKGAIVNLNNNQGKIGDTITIQDQPDVEKIMAAIEPIMQTNAWIETHAWPGALPLERIDKIISITTSTARSKMYRWSRAYHHYFKVQWAESKDIDLIDKARETAKNYLVPFAPVSAPNLINVEFADFVECTAEAMQIIGQYNYNPNIARWKEINNFLYVPDFWNAFESKIFYQAEHEHSLQRYYIY